MITFGIAAAGILYMKQEKAIIDERRRDKEQQMQRAAYGKPNVGGPFSLVDCDTGKQVTDTDFHGKFMVIYFGFTNCPDVCPDELEKMSKVIAKLDKFQGIGTMLEPVFISVDPGRDTPALVKQYIKEFHPRFRGLTGTEEQVREAAKQYRIYVSKGDPSGEDGTDYLVDHSIFFFLMDPEGGLADFYGRTASVEEITDSIMKHIRKWQVSANH